MTIKNNARLSLIIPLLDSHYIVRKDDIFFLLSSVICEFKKHNDYIVMSLLLNN